VNVEAVTSVVDLATLEKKPKSTLQLNDIGQLRLACHRPLFFDAYSDSHSTGAFILIDSITNNTVAAGMIATNNPTATPTANAETGVEAKGQVSKQERAERLGQRGACLLISGPATAETAYAIERALYDSRRVATVLDAGARSSSPMPNALLETLTNLVDLGIVTLVIGASPDTDWTNLRRELGLRFLKVSLGDSIDVDGQHLVSHDKRVTLADSEDIGRAMVELLRVRGCWLE
jgi:hypothetical protein